MVSSIAERVETQQFALRKSLIFTFFPDELSPSLSLAGLSCFALAGSGVRRGCSTGKVSAASDWLQRKAAFRLTRVVLELYYRPAEVKSCYSQWRITARGTM
ncbi:MAG: hypothetical protein R2932_03860 [Caldilineaceae bacterium]